MTFCWTLLIIFLALGEQRHSKGLLYAGTVMMYIYQVSHKYTSLSIILTHTDYICFQLALSTLDIPSGDYSTQRPSHWRSCCNIGRMAHGLFGLRSHTDCGHQHRFLLLYSLRSCVCRICPNRLPLLPRDGWPNLGGNRHALYHRFHSRP